VPEDANGRPLRECIKHAWFHEGWVRAGQNAAGAANDEP